MSDATAATVETSASFAMLAAAMAKAQAELKNPPKDSVNPHFKSKYADLATVRDAVIPSIAKHGLAVMQFPCDIGPDAALVTLLTHSSGEWIKTTMRLRPGKNDPQGIGSALTYARRYALQSIAGVAADDDDDGNAASTPGRTNGKPTPVSNPALVAEYVKRLATAKNRDEVIGVVGCIARDKKTGQLSDADCGTLRAARDEALKAFPAPQKATT